MIRPTTLRATIAAAALLALAGCSKPKPATNESDVVPLPAPAAAAPATSAATPAASAPATPSGPAEPAQARTDEYAVSGASVTQVVWLPNLNAKLYSNAGGDPAVNGLVTYIAFPPETPDEDWKVYQVGDFEDWTLAEQGPGRVVLQVKVTRIDPSSGNPVTEDKKLIINWTTAGENRTVTVTPAG